jgi:hypothetical protein
MGDLPEAMRAVKAAANGSHAILVAGQLGRQPDVPAQAGIALCW